MWARLRSLVRWIDRPLARRARSVRRAGLPSEDAYRSLDRQGLAPAEAARRARTRVRLGRALQGSVASRARAALARRDPRATCGTAFARWGPRRASRSSPSRCSPSPSARTSRCSACSTRCSSACLPVERPQELRELAWVEGGYKGWSISYDGSMRPYPGGRRIAYSFSYPAYAFLRDRSTTFGDLFLFSDQSITAGLGRPRRTRRRARRQRQLRQCARRRHVARPTDLARGRSAGRATGGRAHERRLATIVRERSAGRRSDDHDQRRVGGRRRRHAAGLLRSRRLGGPSTCSHPSFR